MTASLLFFTGSWGKFLGEGGTGRRGKHVILLLERKRYPVIRKMRGRGGESRALADWELRKIIVFSNSELSSFFFLKAFLLYFG